MNYGTRDNADLHLLETGPDLGLHFGIWIWT